MPTRLMVEISSSTKGIATCTTLLTRNQAADLPEATEIARPILCTYGVTAMTAIARKKM